MNNLTNPAAAAASGLPQQNDMSDVINSLKRLERVGSETSETTKKLIRAAEELSDQIVKYFDGFQDGVVIVLEPKKVYVDRGAGISRPEKDPSTPWDHGYIVSREKVCFSSYYAKSSYVALDRENALTFSKDIAAGVLEAIIETATKYHAQNIECVDILSDALAKLKQAPSETKE